MEQDHHQTRMNASEQAVLWSQYINDSMSKCVLKYRVKGAKDESNRSLLQYSLDISEHHLNQTRRFLKQESHPVPIGFTEEDVNIEAPSLFTDTFKIV